ncbi:MAG TPA: DUF3857 and transglutaminase domain-containing protein [Candidatus Angelobacter sp.]|nr:DUF3857 and transglutaminase domain-containing protein [Candidatus Angelobacter sp.]
MAQKDLQVKEVPGSPGADAIQLYYADFINDNTHEEFFYHRIKILTDKGRQPGKYADVEIALPPDFTLSDLKARTIHPDGQIVDFTGKPFEKTLIKGRGIKVLAKTFTLPDVTVGSIVEFKYKLHGPEGVVFDNSWTIQHDLFTVKENLVFKAFEGPLRTEDGTSGYSYTTVNLTKQPTKKGNTVELEMENVPAFEAEGLMPPEAVYKPHVRFFYGGTSLASAEKFWLDLGTRWNEVVERFIGNHKEIREAAAEAIGSETDPEKKLRKLYARAQQVRNLTYERERTTEEEKKEKLKPNDSVVDVLQRGHGTHRDITALFAALARASGFDVSVLLVSSRQSKVFEKNLPDSRQLDSDVADVQFNGKDLYLDPGTKFCPYGFVRWIRTSTDALKLDKRGGVFVRIPAYAQDRAVIFRSANMVLSEDGSAKGEVTVSYTGGEALERRLDAFSTDEAGRKKNLEDELKTWLPNGAAVKMTSAEGWAGTNEPLMVHFSVEVASYASSAGKRLLIPSYLFQAKQKDAFKGDSRKFPIYFPYAFAEVDTITIKVPPGHSLEGAPPEQHAGLPYAIYNNASEFDGTQFVTKRELRVNGIWFPLKDYAQLKDFFNKVQAGDEQQAVLRSGGGTNAQKGN